MSDALHILPTWAPRVKPERIRQLYALDAQGIYDDELIADVGYGLLARCQSFIEANEAVDGRARCPSYGEWSTPGARANKAEWDRRIEHARSWRET
ncbi:MAG: hypothetical protein ACP5HG_14265 [Anaerolineae bacterium]